MIQTKLAIFVWAPNINLFLIVENATVKITACHINHKLLAIVRRGLIDWWSSYLIYSIFLGLDSNYMENEFELVFLEKKPN